VSRNRPGRRSRSTAVFRASTSSGARCTSSMPRQPPGNCSTKVTGSAAAAARWLASSSDTYRLARRASTSWTSVLLPTWRAPWTTAIGVSERISSSRDAACRETSSTQPSEPVDSWKRNYLFVEMHYRKRGFAALIPRGGHAGPVPHRGSMAIGSRTPGCGSSSRAAPSCAMSASPLRVATFGACQPLRGRFRSESVCRAVTLRLVDPRRLRERRWHRVLADEALGVGGEGGRQHLGAA